MKKRLEKKLRLSKETLRNLSERALGSAKGGATFSDCYSCDPLNPCQQEISYEYKCA